MGLGGRSRPWLRPAQPGGWLYNTLPYLEQTGLHRLGAGKPETEKRLAARTAARTALAVLNCPSRRPAQRWPMVKFGLFVAYNAADNEPGDPSVARGDYAINAGSQLIDEYFPGPESLAEGDSPGFAWHNPRDCNGISFERSQVKMAQVHDGASCTILVGERYLNRDHYETGTDGADNENAYAGFDNDNTRCTYYVPLRDESGYTDTFRFGGVHPAVCQFVICDGSVRGMSFSVDGKAFRALGSRNGSEPVDIAAW